MAYGRKKNKLTEEYYDVVYSDHTIRKGFLNSYYIYDYVKTKNNELTQDHLNHSTFSILYLICVLFPNLKTTFNKTILEKTYKNVIDILDDIVDTQKTR